MSGSCSLTCGLPIRTAQINTQGKQTKVSLGLRATAFALGIIALIAGILILCSSWQLSAPIGWSMCVVGGISVILGICLKCINREPQENHLSQKSGRGRKTNTSITGNRTEVNQDTIIQQTKKQKIDKQNEHDKKDSVELEKKITDEVVNQKAKQTEQSSINNNQNMGPKEVFAQPEEIVLPDHDAPVEGISLRDKIIVTCSKKEVCMWSQESGEYLDGIVQPGFHWHRAAIQDKHLVAIDNTAVYVCSSPRKIVFQFHAFDAARKPDHIAISNDIVAIATTNDGRIQVWSCETHACLHEYELGASIKEIAIHNDKLICVCYNKTRNTDFVYVSSLQSGDQVHRFSAQRCAAIYKNKVVCVDSDKTSIYSVDSGECKTSFPQALPSCKKIIVHDDVLIGLLPPKLNLDEGAYYTRVAVWSAVDGTHLQDFNLGKDWVGEEMNMAGNDLVVCGLSSGNDPDLKTAKMWKFRRKFQDLVPSKDSSVKRSEPLSEETIQKLKEQAEKRAPYYADIYAHLCFDESKENVVKQLKDYIITIIDDQKFQKDPTAYMESWQERRGGSEEFRIPEDAALNFFAQVLLLY